MAKSTDKINTTHTILESIADGVFTVDKNWKITTFNRAAEEITGVPRDEAIGSTCRDVFHSNVCDDNCVLNRSIKNDQPIINEAIYIVNSEGHRIPISISASPLKDASGKIIGGVETFRDLSEVFELKKTLEKNYSFQDIISKNETIQKFFNILPDIATSDSTVLIQGESGTGKELFARAIHNLSRRSQHSLVTVNCGALPDTLLESELFGYMAGAFTDAKKDKPGRFELAENGTIFLDEIGDISPALQVRLLRVLQEKTYEPLGSTTTRKANVRIIAATNKDLHELVQKKLFREDLYYRINVVNLNLPPLRDRKEDIPLLINHFLDRFNAIKNRNIQKVSDEVLSILMMYDFPGNVRELENILEYSYILCREDIIQVNHLPDKFKRKTSGNNETDEEPLTLKAIQKRAIEKVLIKNNWKRMATARELGIDKGTLRRMIERLKIKTPK
ncbi:sigma 54-interacting transcriptional regulator [candidate division KSB1 bacterium]|nr:sigma 54-interacting transcriptional regulator [candidate division KSB1 bacterium]